MLCPGDRIILVRRAVEAIARVVEHGILIEEVVHLIIDRYVVDDADRQPALCDLVLLHRNLDYICSNLFLLLTFGYFLANSAKKQFLANSERSILGCIEADF